MSTQRAKADAFRAMHAQRRVLVLPTAWDAASARLYEDLGAIAIGTTSSGIAHTFGHADGEGRLPPDDLVRMVGVIARTVRVPVSADIEGGHGDAQALTEAIIDAGAVGLNIEDRVNDERFVRPIEERARTIAEVREVADRTDVPIVVNARTDTLDFGGSTKDAVQRGNAYLTAGADCVLVIGAREPKVIAAVVRGICGPVNIAVRAGYPSVRELEALGVKRVSVTAAGAVRAFLRDVAAELLDRGTYSEIDARSAVAELNASFRRRPIDAPGDATQRPTGHE